MCCGCGQSSHHNVAHEELLNEVTIQIPNGNALTLSLADVLLNQDTASCAVKKDSGDDHDITNGILVYASVTSQAWNSKPLTVEECGEGNQTRSGV